MKKKFVDLYMDFAKRVAELSYARRLQVGAVIVKDDTVISYGYNGMPAGWDNNCEDKIWDRGAGGWLSPEEFEEQYPYEGWHEETGCNVRYGLKTKPEVLHAEMNCLMKVAQRNESSKDAVLFTTTAPCMDCAKAIFQAGIKEVVYKDLYRSEDGLYFLEKCGIKLTKFELGDK